MQRGTKVAALLPACGRGLTRAHLASAGGYRSARGVVRDPEEALLHALLAGEPGSIIAGRGRGELDAAPVGRMGQRVRGQAGGRAPTP